MNILENIKFTPSGYKVDARVTKDEKGKSCFAFFMSPAFNGTVEEAEANAQLFENAASIFEILNKSQSFIHSMRCVKQGIPDENMKTHEVLDVIQLDDEMILAIRKIIEKKR